MPMNKDFYKAFEAMFNIRVLKKTLRAGSEEINIFLFRMTLKSKDAKS